MDDKTAQFSVVRGKRRKTC